MCFCLLPVDLHSKVFGIEHKISLTLEDLSLAINLVLVGSWNQFYQMHALLFLHTILLQELNNLDQVDLFIFKKLEPFSMNLLQFLECHDIDLSL